jgi:hypothetical protein
MSVNEARRNYGNEQVDPEQRFFTPLKGGVGTVEWVKTLIKNQGQTHPFWVFFR